ncbi:hypothetical protein [Methanobrevibacter arboriphilus]|uniref:hypothetical protein n=1 Tax=Methanobrevibacter arboriphilus TaxID=39441 RepID=UPI000AE364F2|nr:hypothetical protein [Methanobrevibacter arboriphilus]
MSIFLQTQINELKEKVNYFDDYCKKKEYNNGKRQAKIDQIIEDMDDLDRNQKEALKTLLADSECRDDTLQCKIDYHDKEINNIKVSIAEMPNKITKQIAILLSIFGGAMTVLLYLNDIIIFLISIAH